MVRFTRFTFFTLGEVSAMKWGSKVTASAVSIAAIVLSILANYKWH